MRRPSRSTLLAVAASATFASSTNAQSQRQYDFVEDYGDGSGQIFVTKNAADILGVRLVLQAFGEGNDITVRLHELGPSGIPTAEVLTQGVLMASEILPGEPHWYFIEFDTPFAVSAGESMAFIADQIGSGPSGFVGYGATQTNPYLDGFLFFQLSPGGAIFPAPSTDFAFELVYVPAPSTAAPLTLGLLAFRRLRRRCCLQVIRAAQQIAPAAGPPAVRSDP